MNEANFDLYIHDLLSESGIKAEYQRTEIESLANSLDSASKSFTGNPGRPDFIAVQGDFVLVMEDKSDRDKLILRDENGQISQSLKAIKDYAVNGALFYARKILEGGIYTKIFAFGNAGDSKHHTLKPLFVSNEKIIELDEIETFIKFSPDNINNCYKYEVMGETPPEELQLEDILKKARDLHEHLRNYGNLGDSEKPLVVSAILLALREQEKGFKLEQLTGDNTDTDGAKIYKQLENSMKRARVSPDVKREQLLNQFKLITDRPSLNNKRDDLQKTPLKFFAEYLNKNIYSAIKLNNSPEDYIGRFYGEFMRYSGGDGQTLGVVLTPRHITELFCDLINLQPDDVIFDLRLITL